MSERFSFERESFEFKRDGDMGATGLEVAAKLKRLGVVVENESVTEDGIFFDALPHPDPDESARELSPGQAHALLGAFAVCFSEGYDEVIPDASGIAIVARDAFVALCKREYPAIFDHYGWAFPEHK